MTTKNYQIDATDKRLGRLASEVAQLLLGKKEPDYAPNKVAEVTVTVENTSRMDISSKKLKEKTYDSYSGYPGGLRVRTMEKIVEVHGIGEVLRRAVLGMLPKNKLQKRLLQNLVIKD